MDFGKVLAEFGCWVLAAFGGGEILDVAIPTLRSLAFFLSLACPCLCYDDIKSEHAHNRHTSKHSLGGTSQKDNQLTDDNKFTKGRHTFLW